MERFAMGEARKNLTDIVSRVAYGGERITIGRRGKDLAVLVSVEDAERLEELEDLEDVAQAKRVLADMKRSGEKPIPWTQVKKELAAKRRSRMKAKKRGGRKG